MKRVGIGLRIDRDRTQAEALGGARDAAISPRLAIKTERNMAEL
jgi:hypothetical protein